MFYLRKSLNSWHWGRVTACLLLFSFPCACLQCHLCGYVSLPAVINLLLKFSVRPVFFLRFVSILHYAFYSAVPLLSVAVPSAHLYLPNVCVQMQGRHEADNTAAADDYSILSDFHASYCLQPPQCCRWPPRWSAVIPHPHWQVTSDTFCLYQKQVLDRSAQRWLFPAKMLRDVLVISTVTGDLSACMQLNSATPAWFHSTTSGF